MYIHIQNFNSKVNNGNSSQLSAGTLKFPLSLMSKLSMSVENIPLTVVEFNR